MNFLGQRSLAALVSFGFLIYYAFRLGENGNYGILVGAFIFEVLLLYFLHKDYSISFLESVGSPHNFLILAIAGLFVAFSAVGIFLPDLIPGEFLDWVVVWAFIGIRIYQDYYLLVTHKERWNHILIPFVGGLAAVYIYDQFILKNDPAEGFISLPPFWIIIFYGAREIVDWLYDILRWLFRNWGSAR